MKIELIWRELLFRVIDQQNPTFSITGLSQKFKLSTSVVSHALKPIREMNMVKIGKTESSVIDAEKLLFFWATRRNPYKDVIYETTSDLPVSEREASMPQSVIPTAFSAYKLRYETVPADYDMIYYYAFDLKEIIARFPPKKSRHYNVIIFKPDVFLGSYKFLPTPQIFADLWNAKEWYARDFAQELLIKIKTQIGL